VATVNTIDVPRLLELTAVAKVDVANIRHRCCCHWRRLHGCRDLEAIGPVNKNEYVHTHDTRTKNDRHLPGVNTGHGLKCLKYKIPKLWNELPIDLKEQTSLNIFNKKAVLPQGNRAMPQLFFSVLVRRQHSLQV